MKLNTIFINAEREGHKMNKKYKLPYGIVVEVSSENTYCDGGTVSSNLADEIGKESADAIESFLLALACNGVNIGSLAFDDAIEDAVESIVNHQGE